MTTTCLVPTTEEACSSPETLVRVENAGIPVPRKTLLYQVPKDDVSNEAKKEIFILGAIIGNNGMSLVRQEQESENLLGFINDDLPLFINRLQERGLASYNEILFWHVQLDDLRSMQNKHLIGLYNLSGTTHVLLLEGSINLLNRWPIRAFQLDNENGNLRIYTLDKNSFSTKTRFVPTWGRTILL